MDGDVCDGTPSLIVCMEAGDNFTVIPINSHENISFELGFNPGLVDSQPISIYRRGFYFDSGDVIKIKNLALHHTNTIEAWIFMI